MPRFFRAGTHAFDLDERPLVMGVLNVTPDSFSDGNKFLDPERAEDHALGMAEEGADMIDVGAESSRPGAAALDGAEEWARLKPVLERIVPALKVPVSVDTSKYDVMLRALDAGAVMINDIRAMAADARIPGLLARRGASVVLMHMRGRPQTMQDDTAYGDLVGEVLTFLREAAMRALGSGIPSERIAADPGIGFGKSVEGNFELLRSAGRIRRELGVALAFGLSRKSFIQKSAERPADRLAVPMAALHALVAREGADILRVHDIMDTRLALRMTQHFCGSQRWTGSNKP